MGTFRRPMIILVAALMGLVVADQCDEPTIENGVVTGTQTLDAYFGRVSCLPGFQVNHMCVMYNVYVHLVVCMTIVR